MTLLLYHCGAEKTLFPYYFQLLAISLSAMLTFAMTFKARLHYEKHKER